VEQEVSLWTIPARGSQKARMQEGNTGMKHIREHIEMYGIASLSQVSDTHLLQIALGTQKEAETTLDCIRTLVEESNGFEELSRNMQRIEALFEKDAQHALRIGAILEMCKRIVAGPGEAAYSKLLRCCKISATRFDVP
jgi:DNA repair protein RadC